MSDQTQPHPAAASHTRDSSYAALFREFQPGCDPRHVEAYVRLQYSTLGHLDRATLRREARIAAGCIKADPAGAEGLALSYGL